MFCAIEPAGLSVCVGLGEVVGLLVCIEGLHDMNTACSKHALGPNHVRKGNGGGHWLAKTTSESSFRMYRLSLIIYEIINESMYKKVADPVDGAYRDPV